MDCMRVIVLIALIVAIKKTPVQGAKGLSKSRKFVHFENGEETGNFRHKREAPVKGKETYLTSLVNDILKKALKEKRKGTTEQYGNFPNTSDTDVVDLETKIRSIVGVMMQDSKKYTKKEGTAEDIAEWGMTLDGLISPPGYRIQTKYPKKESVMTSQSETAFHYGKGVGNVLLNGCYGDNYNTNDPCYDAKRNLPPCKNMMEGANFIGAGFDSRGDYSSSSRKRSIVQRYCMTGNRYGGMTVPDSMTVHGVYNTQVKPMAFDGIEKYQSYLQKKAATATSRWMFTDALSKATGHTNSPHSQRDLSDSMSDTDQQRKTYISSLEINVIRYEMFLDAFTFEDLNLDFLRDFVSLPETYFTAGAPSEFQNFILRWGTHYIHSAKFGGQLKILKTKNAGPDQSFQKFRVQAQNDNMAMFSVLTAGQAQFGVRDSTPRNQYSNEVLLVEGGEQNIATLVTDMYTTNFKHELQQWLSSIPKYPKPFEFQMSPITYICENLNYKLLFPKEAFDFGCLGKRDIKTETGTGRRYYVLEYEKTDANNKTYTRYEKRYCDFSDETELERAMQRRCRALKRGITVYLEEGPMPSSDINLPAGAPGCRTNRMAFEHKSTARRAPSWTEMSDGRTVKIITDMPADIPGVARAQETLHAFYQTATNLWYVRTPGGMTHLFDGWGNGGSNDVRRNKKISLRGMVMTYNEDTGILTITHEDFVESKKARGLHKLHALFDGLRAARVEYLPRMGVQSKPRIDSRGPFDHGVRPCNVVWSNAHRINPAVKEGKCIAFSALSSGDIFIVFSAIPKDDTTWYYVQINSKGVAIYKGSRMMKYTTEQNARSLGDSHLYENYFVCLQEIQEQRLPTTITIIYGKMEFEEEVGNAYLVFEDVHNPLPVRFFAFGNGEQEVSVTEARVLMKLPTDKHICKGGKLNAGCREACHSECKGCIEPYRDDMCRECRHLKEQGRCVANCSVESKPDAAYKTCICKYMEDGNCVPSCSFGRKPVSSPDKEFPVCECKYIEENECVETCSPNRKPVMSAAHLSPVCECIYKENGKCVERCTYNRTVNTADGISPECCMMVEHTKCVQNCSADRVVVTSFEDTIPTCMCKYYLEGLPDNCYHACPGTTEPVAASGSTFKCRVKTTSSPQNVTQELPSTTA